MHGHDEHFSCKKTHIFCHGSRVTPLLFQWPVKTKLFNSNTENTIRSTNIAVTNNYIHTKSWTCNITIFHKFTSWLQICKICIYDKINRKSATFRRSGLKSTLAEHTELHNKNASVPSHNHKVAGVMLKDDMQRFFTKLMQTSFLAAYCNINPSV